MPAGRFLLLLTAGLSFLLVAGLNAGGVSVSSLLLTVDNMAEQSDEQSIAHVRSSLRSSPVPFPQRYRTKDLKW